MSLHFFVKTNRSISGPMNGTQHVTITRLLKNSPSKSLTRGVRTAVAQHGQGPRAHGQLKISLGLKGVAPAESSRSSCSDGDLMRGCMAALSKSALYTGGQTIRVSRVYDSGL